MIPSRGISSPWAFWVALTALLWLVVGTAPGASASASDLGPVEQYTYDGQSPDSVGTTVSASEQGIRVVWAMPSDSRDAYDPSGCRYATNTADDVLRLSKEESWGNLNTLDDHFVGHGADFGASSVDDYASQASEFFQRAQQQGLPTKIDANGVIRIYDPATNTFGAYNASGTTRTFFTPKRGIDYWHDQPGVAPWSPGP